MAKRFQIFLMILALGFFVIPKQVFFAQTTEMSCCTNTSEKDCCNKDTKKDQKKPCHDSKKNSCNDCTTCHSCHASFIAFGLNGTTNQSEASTFAFSKKENFNYRAPEIQEAVTKIWQPPKIG